MLSTAVYRFFFVSPPCGADGARTRGLRLAKPALSQLSYSPRKLQTAKPRAAKTRSIAVVDEVGVLGFEPRTSALSELRSSQLSYTPFSLRRGQTKKPNRYGFGSIRLAG